MADVRFKLDHHQLSLCIKVVEHLLQERPRGETMNMLHSILQQLVVRMRRRHAERRLEYKFILPVYQAIALRRVVHAGLTFYDEGMARTEMRTVLFVLDQRMTRYITT